MEQTRIGLIGVGRFCPNYHIPNLIQRRDVEITAVCDALAHRTAYRGRRWDRRL